MFIILQKPEKNNPLKIEYEIIKEILTRNGNWLALYEYVPYTYEEFTIGENGELGKPENFPKYFANAVPIGTIEFVYAWMQIYHNHGLNPIEIPKCLRTEEFLKREYKIVSYDDIPKDGSWFIKDASQMKSFSTSKISDISSIDFDKLANGDVEEDNYGLRPINKEHLFQVSSYVDIKAEYRAYFIDGKLENVSLYDGDMTLYPDIKLALKANAIYSLQKDYPKSYSMDLMVSDKGTAIIEIHPFTSIGLYSTLWSDKLINAYRDGINYYIDHNTAVEIG